MRIAGKPAPTGYESLLKYRWRTAPTRKNGHSIPRRVKGILRQPLTLRRYPFAGKRTFMSEGRQVSRRKVDWKTKPTDRFILKWIKCHLSARLTPWIFPISWIHPWMVTLASAALGVAAGLAYGFGRAFSAGCLAAAAQILDGMDGQLARLRGSESRGGAFWDSVLDRYADGAMVAGLTVYLVGSDQPLPPGLILVLGVSALIGSSLISYSSARAECLGLEMGAPTLASKGTRWAVMICGAWGGVAWWGFPLLSLAYLVVHPNLVVLRRLNRTRRVTAPLSGTGRPPSAGKPE